MTRIEVSDEFMVSQRLDGRWTWAWLPGVMMAACHVTGTRGYETKAGAITGARAAIKRLRKYCLESSRGDMV